MEKNNNDAQKWHVELLYIQKNNSAGLQLVGKVCLPSVNQYQACSVQVTTLDE